MLDAAIIGTGPAGLSAAINLKLHEKSFVWFGSRSMSDKVGKAERVMNYPGMPNITGKELSDSFKKHAEEMGLEITEKMVNSIIKSGNKYVLMADNDIYEARTLVLATGVVNATSIKGEEELLGRGVSYCATCDGFLYKNKTIAVVCGAKRFEHEVEYLADIADKVYLFPLYKDVNIASDNVECIRQVPCGICGEKRVTGVALKDGSLLSVDGVFLLRSAIAPSTLLSGLQVEGGHIVVDRNMATSLPGCFAAGDCTGRPYQYTKAVGEGNVAAHSLLDYLAKDEK
jgi:thioredoxin reductase (NADPH)